MSWPLPQPAPNLSYDRIAVGWNLPPPSRPSEIDTVRVCLTSLVQIHNPWSSKDTVDEARSRLRASIGDLPAGMKGSVQLLDEMLGARG